MYSIFLISVIYHVGGLLYWLKYDKFIALQYNNGLSRAHENIIRQALSASAKDNPYACVSGTCRFNMTKSLVFLPHSLYDRKDGFLYGVVRMSSQPENSNGLACYYYVLGLEAALLPRENEHSLKYHVMGHYTTSDEEIASASILPEHRSSQWINVRRTDNSFKVVVSRDMRPEWNSKGEILVIIYDEKVLECSELLLKVDECGDDCQDHLKVLARLLHAQKSRWEAPVWFVMQKMVWLLLSVASIFLSFVVKLRPVLDYSALGSHLHKFLESVVWALSGIQEQKRVSLKLGNYLLATAVDVSGGILLLKGLVYLGLSDPLSVALLRVAKYVVQSLQYLLHWLSGSPAGLKLNGPFSLVLGRFFLYHINLWWIFLSVTQPLLELAFQVLLWLGRLGLTFQLAILDDLLSLVSFHIYCIYVYAARLYYLQLSGLIALWRLFLGRKWNPLRQRVDSCLYSPDQLFVGTLAFTILLFLLPTTAMYYVVFTSMRVVLLVLACVMKQASYFLRALPIYSSFYWLLGSNDVCSSVNVTPKAGSRGRQLVLFVTPIADSWWQTVKNCMPDTIVSPSSIPFGQLIQKLARGELVHPV